MYVKWELNLYWESGGGGSDKAFPAELLTWPRVGFGIEK